MRRTKRTVTINLKLTKEEDKFLRKQARKYAWGNLSEFIRMAGFRYTGPKAFDVDYLAEQRSAKPDYEDFSGGLS